MPEIRLSNISKSFGDVRVINNINLTVTEGEFFTLVGPSGCGKSTILNIIAGLEDLDEGTIYFDNQPVNRLSPRDRDAAMVFQNYALYPHMTVYENIAFPLKIKGMPKDKIEKDVSSVSGLLGIGALLGRLPRQLSGGQRQRTALARAIIRRPKLFLMDEPLSNLDAKLRIEMRAELKKLHKKLHITTIYVTHDQDEAMGISDKIGVLFKGDIQQYGTPEDIFFKPSNIFVADFIGSPPINLIDGKVTGGSPVEIDCNGIRLRFEKIASLPKEKSVTVGIRPEDIKVTDNHGMYTGSVNITEFAGSNNWVEIDWNGVRIKGLIAMKNRITPGKTVNFDISIPKCHLFDKNSTKRLL